MGRDRDGAAAAARYKPVRVNNRPSDVIAPRDTSVAFKWLLSRLCLDADVDLWNSIKLHGIPYRPNRVVASRSKHPPDPSLSSPSPPPFAPLPPTLATVATTIFFLLLLRSARASERIRGYFLFLGEREKGQKGVDESFCHSACARFAPN